MLHFVVAEPVAKKDEALEKLMAMFAEQAKENAARANSSPSSSPVVNKKKSMDDMNQKMPKFENVCEKKQFKFNSPKRNVTFNQEKKELNKIGKSVVKSSAVQEKAKAKSSGTDSCVKISPNLTDDTKVIFSIIVPDNVFKYFSNN